MVWDGSGGIRVGRRIGPGLIWFDLIIWTMMVMKFDAMSWFGQSFFV